MPARNDRNSRALDAKLPHQRSWHRCRPGVPAFGIRASHQARFGLAARANGGRSFHGAARPSGSFTSPLPVTGHQALPVAQRTSPLQRAAEVDIRPRPQEDLQSRVWVVAFGSGASTGFPCSRRRDGCQGRTSLRSLNQSQAAGRRAAGKDCNERNTAMRSCYDAATCRCLASIRLAVLLVVDSPPSLRTEGHFIKKVLVVVACPLCGSIRRLRHCVLSVRLLFVP